jgi:ferredoxin
MRVWIDQDLCTGDGLCVDHCDDVFMQLEDGIAYVKEAGRPLNDPGSSGSLARVPIRLVQRVIHAAEDCPGECIFIEIDSPVDAELDVTVDARIAARIDIRDDAA